MGKKHHVSVTALLSSGPKSAAHDQQLLEMVVFLAANGGLDIESASGKGFSIRRVIDKAQVWSGRLTLEDKIWVLTSADDNDPIWFMKVGIIRPGEYLTLYSPHGDTFGFRVVRVSPYEKGT